MDERLGPHQRLRRRREYQDCYRGGRRRSGILFNLHILAKQGGVFRYGVTASRKVGPAVVRHRLKRWTREVIRRWPERSGLPPSDVVIHLHPAAGRSTFEEFRTQLEASLRMILGGGISRSGSSRPA